MKTDTKKYANIVPNLHLFLNNVKFLRTPKGVGIDTTDLYLTMLKATLSMFKKEEQEALVALLEISEKQYFAGINAKAKESLGVTETRFEIGQNLRNKSKKERFIIEIMKGSKNGELEYGWTGETGNQVCSEKTLVAWLEK
jgi:hypothetical protein